MDNNYNANNNAGDASGAMWGAERGKGDNNYGKAIEALDKAYRDGTAKTDDIIELARLYYDGTDNLNAAIMLLSDALSKARDQLSKIRYIYEALRAVSLSDGAKQIQLRKILYGKLEDAIKSAGNTRLEYSAFLDCMYDALLRRDFGSLERLSAMYDSLGIKENELRRYHKMLKRLEGLYRNGKVHPAVETILNPNTKRMPKNAAPLIIRQIRQIAGSLKTLRGEVPELFKKYAALEQLQNAAAMRYDLFNEFNRMEDDNSISRDIKSLVEKLLIIKYFGADEADTAAFKAQASQFLNSARLETHAAALRKTEAQYPACYRLFSDALLGGRGTSDLFGPEETEDETAPYTEWHSKVRRGDAHGSDDATPDETAANRSRGSQDWQYEAPGQDDKTAQKRAPKPWEYEAPEQDDKHTQKRVQKSEGYKTPGYDDKHSRNRMSEPQGLETPGLDDKTDQKRAPKPWEYEAPEQDGKHSRNRAPGPSGEETQAADIRQQKTSPAEKQPDDNLTADKDQTAKPEVDMSAQSADNGQSLKTAAPDKENTQTKTPPTESAPQKAAGQAKPPKVKKPKEKKRGREKKKKAAAFAREGQSAGAGAAANRSRKPIRDAIIIAAVLAGIAIGITALNNIKPGQSQNGGLSAQETQEINELSQKYQTETGAVITIERYDDATDEAEHAKSPPEDKGFITLRITGEGSDASVGLASNCLPEQEFNELEQQSRRTFGNGEPITADKIKDFFGSAYDSLKNAYDKFPISLMQNPFITYKMLKNSPEDSELTRVPAVYGMSVEQARAKLTEYGLGISVTEKENKKYGDGRVYRQQPEFGVIAKKGEVVTVTANPGSKNGATAAEDSVTVPDFTGMTEQQAVEAAAALSLSLEINNDANAPNEEVTSQQPAAGVSVRKGSVITVTINADNKNDTQRVFELMRAVSGQNYTPAQILSYLGLSADTALTQTTDTDGNTIFSGSVSLPLLGLSGSLRFEMRVSALGQVSELICNWLPSPAVTNGELAEAAKGAGFTQGAVRPDANGYVTPYSSRFGTLNTVSAAQDENANVDYVEFKVG